MIISDYTTIIKRWGLTGDAQGGRATAWRSIQSDAIRTTRSASSSPGTRLPAVEETPVHLVVLKAGTISVFVANVAKNRSWNITALSGTAEATGAVITGADGLSAVVVRRACVLSARAETVYARNAGSAIE